MSNPRVLFMTGGSDGSSLWRVWQPVAELERQGYTVHHCPKDAPTEALMLVVARYRYDAIVLSRTTWPAWAIEMAAEFIDKMHRVGMAVWFECDDDLFLHLEDHMMDPVKLKQGKEAIHTVMLCDGIIVSTPRLKTVTQHATGGTIPVAVCPNLLDYDWWRMIQKQAKRLVPPVTIGWAGANRLDADLAEMAEGWRRVAERFPDVRFVVQGHCAQVVAEAVPADRLHYLPWIELAKYPAGLVNVDIGCCSVADTPFNACKCVVGDTLVHTEQGLIPISSIVQSRVSGIITPLNTRVWTTEGWKMTTFAYSGGEQDTVRVTTKAGYVIEGTPDHRVRRADNEWARLDALVIGDELRIEPVQFAREFVQVPVNAWAVRQRHATDMDAPSLPQVTIDDHWGKLLGYIVGDGFIGKNHVRITCDAQDEDVIEDVVATFRAVGLTAQRITTSGGRKCVDVSASSARFNEFLFSLGVHQEKRKSFAIPDVILRSPESVVAQFIRGLFESDGSASKTSPTVSFSTKSLRLAREVQLILTGFGIQANIAVKPNKVYQRDYYEVRLNRAAVDIFAGKIGFIGQRKRAIVRTITERKHSNAYRPTRWADEIVKIERGRGEVFDLTVPGPTEYAANGIISHNSVIKAMEYGASGAAVVATSALYRQIITHNDTGLIANTADEWAAGLSTLVEDAQYRGVLARRLRRRVVEDYNLQTGAHKWVDAFAWLLEQRERKAA